jgi:hypothetical protein
VIGQVSDVVNSNNGMLVESNNEISFSKSIIELIENEFKRESLGKNLKNTIINNYFEPIILHKFELWLIQSKT